MKIFAGERIKRVRGAMRQTALAEKLGISTTYLHQIERNQRPLTADLLRRLADLFGVPLSYFSDSEDARRESQLREDLGDPLFGPIEGAAAQLPALLRSAPAFADAFMTLYRAYTEQAEQRATLTPRFPYDEVRDWVQSHKNFYPSLDAAAERLFESRLMRSAVMREDLERYLRDTHRVTIIRTAGLLSQGVYWRLNQKDMKLRIADDAAPESEIFWLAHVAGQLAHGEQIEREILRARFSSEDARRLARIGLANYFAGALVMPYGRFHAAAIETRHDIQRLQRLFGASFEQVAHRLSTLQRPDLPGVPFYFAKLDIAGNFLKRSSATEFQFAQFGGPCPLWNVFRAFAHPSEILLQVARTPDGVSYLNIARTVGRGGSSYLSRPRAVAVVLGCETRHAAQMVYAAGLDLRDPEAADPIGPGCRACERLHCRHRSVPPMGSTLDMGTAERGVVPYRLGEG